jgi:hypothetical protein
LLVLFLTAFTSMTAVWLIAHQMVKRRFTSLITVLPSIYSSAIAVPPDEGHPPQLLALCVDLLRKSHCTTPFETLTPAEQHMVLHVHAIDAAPAWMSRYAALRLSKPNRAILDQLRRVKSSRPERSKEHYGAVKALLRSRSES